MHRSDGCSPRVPPSCPNGRAPSLAGRDTRVGRREAAHGQRRTTAFMRSGDLAVGSFPPLSDQGITRCGPRPDCRSARLRQRRPRRQRERRSFPIHIGSISADDSHAGCRSGRASTARSSGTTRRPLCRARRSASLPVLARIELTPTAGLDEKEKTRVGRRARPPTLLQLVQCDSQMPAAALLRNACASSSRPLEPRDGRGCDGLTSRCRARRPSWRGLDLVTR